MKIRHSFSLLLAAVLLFSVAMPAYAAEYMGETISAQQSVPVSVTEEESFSNRQDTSVLGIEVTWSMDTLQFISTQQYGGKWDPASLSFKKDYYGNPSYSIRSGGSSPSTLNICSVTNRSLWDVTVTPSFVAADLLQNTTIANGFNFLSSAETLTKATANTTNLFEAGTVGGSANISANLAPNLVTDKENIIKIINDNDLSSVGTITLTVAKAS